MSHIIHKTKAVLILIAVLFLVGLVYVLFIYPNNVKKTCTRVAATFSGDYQKGFYRNCIAESGVKIK